MEERPPDPDLQDGSTTRDDASTYDDAIDAVVASDLTGQTPTTAPKTRSAPPRPLERVSLSQQAILGPAPGTPPIPEGSRKRHRQRPPSPSLLEESEDITGTPRSIRVGRLFPGSSGATAKPLGSLVQRLLNISRAALVPKTKRAKSINVDVESAADILAIVGLIQEHASIMEARRVVFDPNRQTAPTPTPSSLAANARFKFRSDALSSKVDQLADQVAKLVSAISPDQRQAPRQTQAANSYALAASRHAPKGPQGPTTNQTSAKTQPRPNTRVRMEASLTLTQQDPKHISGAGKSITELIKSLNMVLKDNNIKLSPSDTSHMAVRNIHRHPSHDLVIYVESQKQAQALRDQVDSWLPKVSPYLALKQEVHSVIVHGIPTTFNPTRQEDVDLLKTCNGELLDNALFVRWLKRDTADDAAKRHSSLLIGFKTLAEAALAARTKVWHGRGRHRTEISGPPPTRCFNCLGVGHTAAACKTAPMCPYCSGNHHLHNCPSKGGTALKCIICAREKLKADPTTNLTRLFKDNHADFLHHPFSPLCPVRIASQLPVHNPSSLPNIQVIHEAESSVAQC